MVIKFDEKYFKRGRKTTVVDVISHFFKKGYKPSATFYDDGIIQCYGGKFRSFSDMYIVCKSYFPNLTFETFVVNVYLAIYKHNINSIKKVIKDRIAGRFSSYRIFYIFFCDEINKYNFYYDEISPDDIQALYIADRFLGLFDKYIINGKYDYIAEDDIKSYDFITPFIINKFLKITDNLKEYKELLKYGADEVFSGVRLKTSNFNSESFDLPSGINTKF